VLLRHRCSLKILRDIDELSHELSGATSFSCTLPQKSSQKAPRSAVVVCESAQEIITAFTAALA